MLDQIDIQDIVKIAKDAGQAIMKIYNQDFALEYKKAKGEKFLKSIFQEIDDYKKSKKLNISGINTYTNLFKKYKKKIL